MRTPSFSPIVFILVPFLGNFDQKIGWHTPWGWRSVLEILDPPMGKSIVTVSQIVVKLHEPWIKKIIRTNQIQYLKL